MMNACMDDVFGRAKGGKARAEVMTPTERTDAARKAAAARWAGPTISATHVGTLKIGDAEIPCAVLEDGTRLLTQAGFLGALGRSTKPKGRSQTVADGLPPFLNTISLQPLITPEIVKSTVPVVFRTVTGAKALGYRAELLPQVCNLFLEARDQDLLAEQQQGIAAKCDVLIRGLAQVGIVALVDEATGYQRDRARDALAKILEHFIAKELQPYVPTFPNDYYAELFRLRGLDYPTDSVKRPQYFGMLTNDIVYKRLAPGVLAELKRVTPKDETGRHKQKLFQRLTANMGYPKLREHLGGVVATMKLSRDYHQFVQNLDRLYPRYGETMALPLDYQNEKDDGKGL